jgi:hypothetical protein
VLGWGVDARREDRPGVPREMPPQKMGNAHWSVPEQQHSRKPAAIERRHELTPVYGTVNPPAKLSGLVRRLAYRAPDYRPRRWMLLMLADRIDVLEHRLVPAAVVLVTTNTLNITNSIN